MTRRAPATGLQLGRGNQPAETAVLVHAAALQADVNLDASGWLARRGLLTPAMTV